MGYELEAIIARDALLRPHARCFPSAHIVTLPQGFALMPFTDGLALDVHEAGPRERRTPIPDGCFSELTAPVAAWLEEVSEDGPVAYLEIYCFGGDCDRAAIVWEHATIVLGPFSPEDDQERIAFLERWRQDPEVSVADLPELSTNRALRYLGVKWGDAGDEFATLNLGAHRHTGDWTTAA